MLTDQQHNNGERARAREGGRDESQNTAYVLFPSLALALLLQEGWGLPLHTHSRMHTLMHTRVHTTIAPQEQKENGEEENTRRKTHREGGGTTLKKKESEKHRCSNNARESLILFC